jgi:methylthioribose-1-phosphate isomerase
LPGQEIYVNCKTAVEVARAIKTMVIRGAPAIGVAAAMGICARDEPQQGAGHQAVRCRVQQALRSDGRHAADGRQFVLGDQAHAVGVRRGPCRPGKSVDEIKARLVAESTAIHDEDVESCRTMGRFGAAVVPDNARILTHCNAGALATAGYGTALGVIRAAAEQGKVTQVFADETRPFLQGARLTAWELVRDHIPTTVITESMAGPLMRDGKLDMVVVGADRIAANGDFANKIGTYTVAMMAKAHNVPFYVAAPLSTIDLATADGAAIPIEQRNAKEVTHLGPTRLAPEGASVWNPAFDVTPHHLVAGIITEKGVARAPFSESLKALFEAGTHEMHHEGVRK